MLLYEANFHDMRCHAVDVIKELSKQLWVAVQKLFLQNRRMKHDSYNKK